MHGHLNVKCLFQNSLIGSLHRVTAIKLCKADRKVMTSYVRLGNKGGQDIRLFVSVLSFQSRI